MAASSYVQLQNSLSQTQDLATKLSEYLQIGDVVLLVGTLGAGKTAFARALIQSMGYDDEVPSPTFNLVLVYEPPVDRGDCPPVWHFDLYRLESEDELPELGYEQALEEAVTVIEWPDRLGSYLPDDFLKIEIRMTAQDGQREIMLAGYGAWQDRLGWIAQEQGWCGAETAEEGQK